MKQDKEIKPILIGDSGVGLSASVLAFLSERGISAKDVVALNSSDVKDVEIFKEKINSIPGGKVILIEDINLIIEQDSPEKVFTINNPLKDIELLMIEPIMTKSNIDWYIKKDFGGHKSGRNQKLRRR
jgi:hypothetical protein